MELLLKLFISDMLRILLFPILFILLLILIIVPFKESKNEQDKRR